MTDYCERQKRLRAEREAGSNHLTPEQMYGPHENLAAAANARVSAVASRLPGAAGKSAAERYAGMCFCPGDCNCKNPHRTTFCGCKGVHA